MKFIETLRLALGAIWAHKLRSVLTLIGLIVGVTAFALIVSLIQGFNAYVDEKIAGIGAKSFTVRRFSFEDFKDTDTIAAAQRRNKDMTLADYEFLRARAVVIDRLGAMGSPTRHQIKREAQLLEVVQVGGATPNIAEIEKIDVADGRFFSDPENEAAANVAFVGPDVIKEMFPGGGSPLGEEIAIDGLPYRIIGVAVAKGTVFGIPQDNFVTLPLKTYGKNFGGLTRQRSLYFEGTAKSDALFPDAVEEVRQLMRQRRRLAQNEKDNFGILTPDAITGIRDRVFGPIFIVAIVVPGIALVIGGIVVMNIMLVSVTERTKEIGIRKAIGARQGDILKQFLVEAVVLAGLGGAMGVFLAWAIGRIITAVFFPTLFSVVAVTIALVVSGGIGVLAGIFPAWKAAKLDPIEALRAD